MTEQPWKMPNNPTDTFDGSLSTEWELEALFLHLSLYLLLFFIPSLSTHHMDKSRAHGNDQSSTAGASCGHVEEPFMTFIPVRVGFQISLGEKIRMVMSHAQDYEAAILAANAEYDVKKAFVQSLARDSPGGSCSERTKCVRPNSCIASQERPPLQRSSPRP